MSVVKVDPDRESLSKLRCLLNLTASRTVLTRNGQCKGGKDLPTPSDQWRMLFNKVDEDGNGTLCLSEFKHLIRKEMKLSERAISDSDLVMLFQELDTDGNGIIDLEEFLKYVNKGKKDKRDGNEVLFQVGRCVRMSIRRHKWSAQDVANLFEHRDDGASDFTKSDGTLGPREVRMFFRQQLKIGKHDCSDKNIVIAFKELDVNGSMSLSLDDFMDFIKTFAKSDPPALPQKKSSEAWLSPRETPSRRLRSLVLSVGDTTVPFNLYSRQINDQGRLACSQRKMGLHSMSAPDLMTAGHGVQAGISPSTICGSDAFSQASSPMQSPKQTPSQSPKHAWGAGSSSSNLLAGSLAAITGSFNSKTQADNEFPTTHGTNYLAIKGGQALNRVESILFKAGVDVRGGYHRLR